MKLVNLTPHALHLYGTTDSGCTGQVSVPSSGTIARLAVRREGRGSLAFGDVVLDVVAPTFGSVHGLPDPEDGVLYIASALVAEAVKRPDVMSPGEALRDVSGAIIGARGLCCYHSHD